MLGCVRVRWADRRGAQRDAPSRIRPKPRRRSKGAPGGRAGTASPLRCVPLRARLKSSEKPKKMGAMPISHPLGASFEAKHLPQKESALRRERLRATTRILSLFLGVLQARLTGARTVPRKPTPHAAGNPTSGFAAKARADRLNATFRHLTSGASENKKPFRGPYGQ